MSKLVIAALEEAWNIFGGFPVERQPEIARWVQQRVERIRRGDTRHPPIASTGYEREPGEEG